MRTAPDCVPCLLRQTLAAVRCATPDEAVHGRILQLTLGALLGVDMRQPPPAVSQVIQRLLRRETGAIDPYGEAKAGQARLAQTLLPGLAAQVRRSRDPLRTAVQIAIAANLIDLGAKSGLDEAEVSAAIRRAPAEPLHGELQTLRRALPRARRILWLADNAGEIVLDRLVIEQLPTGRVIVAVRGAAVLNDATRADATAAGLPAGVRIIDNGSDAPGTLLADCSAAFRSEFQRADLIIAKGQGNFESLADDVADVFFLFRVKCVTVAAQIGRPVGTNVLWRSPGRTVRTQRGVTRPGAKAQSHRRATLSHHEKTA